MIHAFLLWMAASGLFALGYCVGACMGLSAGIERANKAAEQEKPFLDRY